MGNCTSNNKELNEQIKQIKQNNIEQKYVIIAIQESIDKFMDNNDELVTRLTNRVEKLEHRLNIAGKV